MNGMTMYAGARLLVATWATWARIALHPCIICVCRFEHSLTRTDFPTDISFISHLHLDTQLHLKASFRHYTFPVAYTALSTTTLRCIPFRKQETRQECRRWPHSPLHDRNAPRLSSERWSHESRSDQHGTTNHFKFSNILFLANSYIYSHRQP